VGHFIGDKQCCLPRPVQTLSVTLVGHTCETGVNQGEYLMFNRASVCMELEPQSSYLVDRDLEVTSDGKL